MQIFDFALNFPKETVFNSNKMYVFITNKDVISTDHLEIYALPQSIWKIEAAENGEKPKLGLSITELLFLINLQCFLLNVCFWEW